MELTFMTNIYRSVSSIVTLITKNRNSNQLAARQWMSRNQTPTLIRTPPLKHRTWRRCTRSPVSLFLYALECIVHHGTMCRMAVHSCRATITGISYLTPIWPSQSLWLRMFMKLLSWCFRRRKWHQIEVDDTLF